MCKLGNGKIFGQPRGRGRPVRGLYSAYNACYIDDERYFPHLTPPVPPYSTHVPFEKTLRGRQSADKPQECIFNIEKKPILGLRRPPRSQRPPRGPFEILNGTQ